jgi:hypothetical protein
MPSSTQTGNAGSGQIFLYFSQLTFLVYFVLPHGYFLDITTTYMLKDQLRATAAEVATFRLLTALPVYLSFLFGLTRDLWNPFGLRDRGYFLIFGAASAAVFVWMALSDLTYAGLFAGMLLVMLSFRFVAAAYQGLIALVGQERLMSGRLSAVWNIFSSVPYVIGAFASGWVAENLRPSQTFMVMTVGAALIALIGLWKPRAVFGHAYDRPEARGSNFLGDIRRLLCHRAIYPAVLLMFMFQFSPAQNTPLQFYLTNEVHASDAVYGYFYAIFSASFIPVWLLYGYLCKRMNLRRLLWLGIVITVPQLVPLLFIRSGESALWAAVPIGMMGAIAAGAIYDLAMRSCPAGMQGTLMMMVDGANQLSYRGGDLLGSAIYDSSPTNGFLYCVLATTAVYALMLPVILFVPKSLLATADGEASPAVEAERLAEIA